MFIQSSVESGQTDTEDILQSVYNFLERTKNDLQQEMDQSIVEQKQSS